MFGGDGNLSDSSNDASHLSSRSESLNDQGQLLESNLNLSISSNSSVGQDPKIQEIRRLKAQNFSLKRQLRDIIGDSEDEDEDARKD